MEMKISEPRGSSPLASQEISCGSFFVSQGNFFWHAKINASSHRKPFAFGSDNSGTSVAAPMTLRSDVM